jgi:hypothetical protein
MKELSKNKEIKNNSSYTEDWLPIRDIQNGMVITDNGYKVTGVKIRPRNIFILDYISQDNVMIGLKNLYNSIDFEFWLMSADRPVDITSYLAKLELLYNQIQEPEIKRLVMQDITKAENFMDNNVTDTEYYLLFKEKDNEAINKKLRTIITGLSNCGLDSAQTTNEDLRVIIDNFLNGGVKTEFRTVTSDVI